MTFFEGRNERRRIVLNTIVHDRFYAVPTAFAHLMTTEVKEGSVGWMLRLLIDFLSPPFWRSAVSVGQPAWFDFQRHRQSLHRIGLRRAIAQLHVGH